MTVKTAVTDVTDVFTSVGIDSYVCRLSDVNETVQLVARSDGLPQLISVCLDYDGKLSLQKNQ